MEEIINDVKQRMEKTLAAMKDEVVKLRTGKASAALLQGLKVDYYGTPTPLMEIAAISTPEPRLLVVKSYDPTQVDAVTKAIQAANLGLNPSRDGNIIRIAIPPLSEERRKELVKLLKRKGEEAKVALRNIRRDANSSLQEGKKKGDIPEDLAKRGEKKVQDLIDDFSRQIDGVIAKKEKDIMEV